MLEKSFQKQGINIMTGARVEASEFTNGIATLTVSKGDETSDVHCDKVLVAVGLEGNVEGTGLDSLGIEMRNGFIAIDDVMRTNLSNVYAVGDVTGAPLLATPPLPRATSPSRPSPTSPQLDWLPRTYPGLPTASPRSPVSASQRPRPGSAAWK